MTKAQMQQKREEQIGFVNKFRDELNNINKLPYMKFYVSLSEALENLTEANPTDKVYKKLLEYIDQVDFRYEIDNEYVTLIKENDQLQDFYSSYLELAPKVISKSKILDIVVKYKNTYNVKHEVSRNPKIMFYESFYHIDDKPVCLVEFDLPPSTFEGTDTITYVVNIPKRKVEYLIGPTGSYTYPHEASDDFTEEEWDDLGLDSVE